MRTFVFAAIIGLGFSGMAHAQRTPPAPCGPAGQLSAELSKNTLVYMLAHDSRDAAAASWRAFGQDPVWQEMSRSTQVDGQFLASRPVNQFLNPTDFSPAK